MSDVIVPVWTLGDRLGKARKLAGLSPAAMALRIGVTDKTIRNWESGATPIPRGQVIAYGHITGVDVDWLLADDLAIGAPVTEREQDWPCWTLEFPRIAA